MGFPKIPLARWVDVFVEKITDIFGGFFEGISNGIEFVMESIVNVLNYGPNWVLILILSALAFYISRWGLALFTLIGLLLIDNLGYWDATIDSLALVLSSVIITIIIGLPLGIWAARSDTARSIITPIMDFMQTMPAFVYLIPAILFFGIGVVPGIIASVIFAVPPTIRLTNLGIREVPKDLIEASDAFGSTPRQKLFKVQLPIAAPTILAGINQSIMLTLSMVVVASLVGAPGLGAEVYRAVTQVKVGQGFEAGLSIVIIAIILDRISQNLRKPAYESKVSKKYIYGIVALLFIILFIIASIGNAKPAEQADPGNIGAKVDYKITGIDPGAGLMRLTKEAMDEYELDEWTLTEGSSAAMMTELKKAYKKEEPIIITGWIPHWMFQKYDLKFLEDPKHVYGSGEYINTLTRKGFKQENPGAYKILDQFFWTPQDMGEVMIDVEEGEKPEAAAAKWIKGHQDKVKKWVTGAQRGTGQKVTLTYVAWESEVASNNVIALVLQEHGYTVDLKQVEAGPMFAAVADGSADAMVSAGLPTTHKDYYETYKAGLEDLGPNLKGTKLGLTVPKYMEDVNSMEDLQND
ncbi:glycine betaine/proline transport system substrate-binding protein [Peribacillus deserti]|uniref:Glycine betaine/proline transport system substrate-binding protein n=1 Tax=Peribacillus deserti TaxID=673318 RepID=A0ABS2QGC3_9BACI|nr:glycine betaine ABC transporter substrate-binding protein [Peribacillus deserti]MBM7691346.1 glycine betaine/proline transport system substrate-binding protein [Peribacillus deserti]